MYKHADFLHSHTERWHAFANMYTVKYTSAPHSLIQSCLLNVSMLSLSHSLSLTTHSALPEAHRGTALLLILKARFIWCHCFSFWLVNRDMTSDTQKTKGTEISYHVQRRMTWILQVNSLFLQPPTSYTQLGHTNTTKQRQKGKHNQFYHIHDRFMYFNISALFGHGP